MATQAKNPAHQLRTDNIKATVLGHEIRLWSVVLRTTRQAAKG
jgi:hypothetical protein